MGLRFLFISSKSLVLSAYHLAHSRETLPAVITMTEAIRTAEPQQKISLITDGNPSYPAGIHFMNEKRPQELPRIEHHAVIGLQNLDQESETYRSFKQLIERLNRTFKFHVRPASGFLNPITARSRSSFSLLPTTTSFARTSHSTTKLQSRSPNLKMSQRSKANGLKSCPW